MTDTPAHTPLPWAFEEGHVQRDSGGIRYWQITDGQDAIACNQFCYAGYDPAVSAANAAFIVRACNSHYQLVEALNDLASLIFEVAPAYAESTMVANARAALSQAGGASE